MALVLEKARTGIGDPPVSPLDRTINSIVGPRNPFKGISTLDTRAWHQRRDTYLVEYRPGVFLPTKLGMWPVQPGEDSERAAPVRHWVEPPAVGQKVVLKMQDFSLPQYDTERVGLLRLNGAVDRSVDARPIRLYGYGMHDTDKDRGYLVLEYVEPPAHSLAGYIPEGESLPVRESVQITQAMTEALYLSHIAGVTHGDLEGDRDKSAFMHVFWDPETELLRIIDWSHARTKNSPVVPHSSEFEYDHMGIGEVLMQLFTGKTYREIEREDVEAVLTSQVSSELKAFIIRIIGSSTENQSMQNGDRYNGSWRGTAQLRRDLQQLQSMLQG